MFLPHHAPKRRWLRFLYSRGYLSHQKLYGGNLLKCADAIFSHELCGESQ